MLGLIDHVLNTSQFLLHMDQSWLINLIIYISCVYTLYVGHPDDNGGVLALAECDPHVISNLQVWDALGHVLNAYVMGTRTIHGINFSAFLHYVLGQSFLVIVGSLTFWYFIVIALQWGLHF